MTSSTPPVTGTAAAAPRTPNEPTAPSIASHGRPGLEHRRTGFPWGVVFLALFGVVLPLFTLGFELYLGGCAEIYLDPIPTALHAFLVALVPFANLAALTFRERIRAGHAPDPRAFRLIWVANAAAFAIGLAYTLLFLPLTPFAVIGILYVGIGLLPLSPLFGFIVAWRLGSGLKRAIPGLAERCRGEGRRAAFAAGAVLVLLAVPGLFTRQLATMATRDDPAAARSALHWLRLVGHRDTLLRMAYDLRPNAWGTGLFPHVSPDQARDLYFRATGDAHNAVTPPTASAKPVFSRRGLPAPEGGVEWDSAVGSESVASRVSGLSLQSSRLEITADPDAAWSYSEWTLEFRNAHARDAREARAQVQLPPGAVVSRLTLWVNGEEAEAAFAGRSQVREAYQQVAVVRRRDPVLVTTSGPDRVLVQCFPVPANGGTMKIRLGITAPLLLPAADQALQLWPRFLEHNFAIPPSFEHQIWVESPRSPLALPRGFDLVPEPENSESKARSRQRGTFSDPSFADPASILRWPRHADSPSAWATDSRDAALAHVRQTLAFAARPAPPRLAVVIDGSKDMRAHLPAISEVLKRNPPGTELAVFLAADDVRQFSPSKQGRDAGDFPDLRSYVPEGGCDNALALHRALDWAAAKPGSRILWIHGPQPIASASLDVFAQEFERRDAPSEPSLVDFPVRLGPNRIGDRLSRTPSLSAAPRLGTVRDDLARLMDELTGRMPVSTRSYERITDQATATTATGESRTGHLVRLWAAEQATKLWRARRVAEAVAIASRYQLVTPATGAVVLENRRQFTEAGLEPVDPATTPTIPEPGPAWLFLVGAILLSLRTRTRTGRIPAGDLARFADRQGAGDPRFTPRQPVLQERRKPGTPPSPRESSRPRHATGPAWRFRARVALPTRTRRRTRAKRPPPRRPDPRLFPAYTRARRRPPPRRATPRAPFRLPSSPGLPVSTATEFSTEPNRHRIHPFPSPLMTSPKSTVNRRTFLRSTAATGLAIAATSPASVLAADGKINLALVGCAHIHTPSFVNLLKGRPDVTVKYAWDHIAARSEKRGEDLEAKIVDNPDVIWKDPSVQGVVICSETNRHPALVKAAAAAGKHMFIEKPLGITAAESLGMAKAIESAKLLFTTGYFMRMDPKHLFLKDQVKAGAFGTITRAQAWNCHGGSLGGWFDAKPNDPANSWRWMADTTQAGVGGFGDLGTHSLDILMWLLGAVDSVSADVRVVTSRYGPKTDETGQAMMKFANGAMGTLTAGWLDVANPVTLMISGTRGFAHITGDKLYFKSDLVPGAKGVEPVTNLPAPPRAPLHQFVDAIAGKPDAVARLVTPSEAAARVVVMEAMYKSTKAGKWTKVG